MPTSNVDIVLRARDEATAKLKAVTGSMEGLVGTVSRLSFALGTGGAIAAGLVGASAAVSQLVQHYADVAESIQNVSTVTKVAATNVQIFRQAVEMGGGTAEEADRALTNMADAVRRQDPLLKKLGASGLSTWDALMKVADSADAGAAGMELLGKKSTNAIAVLANGSDTMRLVGDHLKRLGVVMSDETVERFARAGDLIDYMRKSFEGLKLVLASAFVPVMIKVLELFAQLQLRVAALYPMLKLLGHAMDYLSSFASNPLNSGDERGKLTKAMERDALGLAAALANANQQWAEMKRLLEALGRTEVPPPPAAPGGGDLGAQVRWYGRSIPASSVAQVGGRPSFPYQVGPMLDEAKTHLMTFSELMEKVSGNIVRTFDTIGQALQGGIVSVFMNLTNRMQTFKSAIVTLMQAVRDGFLRAIGEMVSAAIVKQFLKLLGLVINFFTGGGFTPAIVAGTSVSTGLPTDLSPVTSGAASMRAVAQNPGGDTYVFNMIGPKDVFGSKVDPRGSMRKADSRIYELAGVQ